MKLCVPTLCRYDLLERLARSAEAGVVKPSGYVIIDNGGKLASSSIGATLRELLGDRLRLITPESNLGVAKSWNVFLALDEPVVISNDDIELGPLTFKEMAEAALVHPFVEGEGWALFAQSPECTRRVGYYDENFWPAYYEDVDYDRRLSLAGIVPFRAPSTPVAHAGWATSRALEDTSWLTEGRARNYAYYLQKWGAGSANPRWNGHPGIVPYQAAFNGSPPIGWSERKRLPELPMRWDVLNHIARRIRAERYLEIGVSDGTCLRQIHVKEKWGVDPHPSVSGVVAADVFVARTSDVFLCSDQARRAAPFDLVFIDGDHRAEQVLREVEAILPLLSAKGVIVMHDCNPHSEAIQRVPGDGGEWTGDVWKAIVALRQRGEHAVRVVSSDYGVGILIPHRPGPPPFSGLPDTLQWHDLVARRQELLGLLDPWHWTDWFEASSSV